MHMRILNAELRLCTFCVQEAPFSKDEQTQLQSTFQCDEDQLATLIQTASYIFETVSTPASIEGIVFNTFVLSLHRLHTSSCRPRH